MKAWQTIRAVALFEFMRVFKPKDVAVTLVLFVCGALFFAWVKSDQKATKAPITVIGDALEFPNLEHLPFTFLPAGEGISEEQAREMIASGDMGMALFARGVDDVEVLIRDERPDWYRQFEALVGEVQRMARVRETDLPQEQLDEVLGDAALTLTVQAPDDVERKGKLKFLAGACLATMMMGLFIGSVHLFTGITGEKQNHVTESVLSAVPVQAWIDGKCLGVVLASFAGLVTIGGCWAIANLVYGIFQEPMRLPLEIVDFGMFAGFIVFALLGFLMWFAFFAAVAATIDDPNTSSRGMFMFVPAMATGVGFIGAEHPGSRLYRLASYFPLTSPGAMPVRLLSGTAAAWEVALALALLLAAFLAFRVAARKIFAMAMLMRGKELAWREVWRAFRAPS